jgi:hypothetical protein
MYEPNIDPTTGTEISNTIRRISDGLIITFDITTPEYQEYLTQYYPQLPEEHTVL